MLNLIGAGIRSTYVTFWRTLSSFLIFSIIGISFTCCNDSKVKCLKTDDPVENIVNYVTSARDNLMVELPELYDSLTTHISDDTTERIILVEALKKRDFRIIEWGRGNYTPLAPRIVSVKMKKGDCFCQIDKIYYKSISDSLYQMTERIRCSDSLAFY